MTGVLNSDASRLPESDPTGYYQHALGPLRPAPQEGAGWMFAAGELAMPASDLALWNISLMNRTLLAPGSYEEMFREVKLKDGSGSHYGLGVFVGVQDGHRTVAHSGEVSGFVSQNVVFPDDKVAVTVLTNEDASSAAGLLARKIESVVLGGREGSDGVDRSGGEAGFGVLRVAGGKDGSFAVDRVLRCLLYSGGGAGLCDKPEATGSAEQLQAGG